MRPQARPQAQFRARVAHRYDASLRRANNLLAMQHGMRDGVTEAATALTGRQMVSPENTLLIPDAGNPGVWSFLWDITQINSYI